MILQSLTHSNNNYWSIQHAKMGLRKWKLFYRKQTETSRKVNIGHRKRRANITGLTRSSTSRSGAWKHLQGRERGIEVGVPNVGSALAKFSCRCSMKCDWLGNAFNLGARKVSVVSRVHVRSLQVAYWRSKKTLNTLFDYIFTYIYSPACAQILIS